MALKKVTVDYDYLISASDADYITNLNNLVRRDFDVVYGVGFLLEKPIGTIADQKPDAQFAIIDAIVDKPNVASAMFKEQEGSYLSRCCCCSNVRI